MYRDPLEVFDMNIDEETGRKIQELQILEQNLQSLLIQKQTVEIELNEILNALSELKKTEEEVYKVVGGIMLRSDKLSLIKELEEKKKILDLRISTIEKQEKILEEKSEKLREQVKTSIANHKD